MTASLVEIGAIAPRNDEAPDAANVRGPFGQHDKPREIRASPTTAQRIRDRIARVLPILGAHVLDDCASVDLGELSRIERAALSGELERVGPRMSCSARGHAGTPGTQALARFSEDSTARGQPGTAGTSRRVGARCEVTR